MTRVQRAFLKVLLLNQYYFRAVNKLKGIAYYQWSQAISEYLDKFQTLIANTSYTNPHTIIVKFCHSL